MQAYRALTAITFPAALLMVTAVLQAQAPAVFRQPQPSEAPSGTPQLSETPLPRTNPTAVSATESKPLTRAAEDLAVTTGDEKANVDSANATRQEAASISTENVLDGDAAAIMKEILSIRRMFGDLLEGTEVESSVIPTDASEGRESVNQPSFAAELRRVISANAVDKQNKCSTTKTLTPALSNEQDAIVGVLRGMSRDLDDRANQFEQQRRYSDADRLRSLAQQVRIQARSFEQPGTMPVPATSYYSAPQPAPPVYSATPPATTWRPLTPPQRISPAPTN